MASDAACAQARITPRRCVSLLPLDESPLRTDCCIRRTAHPIGVSTTRLVRSPRSASCCWPAPTVARTRIISSTIGELASCPSQSLCHSRLMLSRLLVSFLVATLSDTPTPQLSIAPLSVRPPLPYPALPRLRRPRLDDEAVPPASSNEDHSLGNTTTTMRPTTTGSRVGREAEADEVAVAAAATAADGQVRINRRRHRLRQTLSATADEAAAAVPEARTSISPTTAEAGSTIRERRRAVTVIAIAIMGRHTNRRGMNGEACTGLQVAETEALAATAGEALEEVRATMAEGSRGARRRACWTGWEEEGADVRPSRSRVTRAVTRRWRGATSIAWRVGLVLARPQLHAAPTAERRVLWICRPRPR